MERKGRRTKDVLAVALAGLSLTLGSRESRAQALRKTPSHQGLKGRPRAVPAHSRTAKTVLV